MSKVKVSRNDRPGGVVRRTVEILNAEGVATWAGGRSTVATMSQAADQLLVVRPEVELRRVVRDNGAEWEWSLPPVERVDHTGA